MEQASESDRISEFAGSAVPDVSKMVTDAALMIKKRAAERKLKEKLASEELNSPGAAAAANSVSGKRSIQPKNAFLLAFAGAADNGSGSDSEEGEEAGERLENERSLARSERHAKKRVASCASSNY